MACWFLLGLIGCGSAVPSDTADAETADTAEQPGTDVPFTPPSVETRDYVYVASREGNRVTGFAIDSAGTLTTVDTETLTDPAPMTHVDDRLYVGLRLSKSIVSFEIEPGSGALRRLGPPVGIDIEPVYMSVGTDDNIYVASYDDQQVSRLITDEDRRVTGTAVRLDMQSRTHAVIDIDDSLLVTMYSTNQLRLLDVETLETLEDVDLPANARRPRHVIQHPDVPLLYVLMEDSSNIVGYDIEASGLRLRRDWYTLPDGTVQEGNTAADLHITPDGRFLYSSNRGHDSIAMYAVSSAGNLTRLGHQPTEARPRDIAISPDGQFVIVAGMDTGRVATYRIGEDGLLTELATREVPSRPAWVEAVRIPL